MAGRIAILAMLVTALLAGVAMWYLQLFAFYERIEAPEIRATTAEGRVEPLPVTAARAIDASSSPIRFRACFQTTADPARFAPYDGAEPLEAPGWFDCFDAAAIGAALERGDAVAVLGEAGIRPDVDRVIAIFPDGRGFAWHQLGPDADR